MMPEYCDCCQFETDDLTQYARDTSLGENRHKWLCNLCSSTITGTRYEYRGSCTELFETLKTICYVGNVILKEIENK